MWYDSLLQKKMRMLDPDIDKEVREAKRIKAWADREEKKLKKHKKELKSMLKEEHKEEKKEEDLLRAEEFQKEHSNPDPLSKELAYMAAEEERQE
jgi:hypothetical protein